MKPLQFTADLVGAVFRGRSVDANGAEIVAVSQAVAVTRQE
jgi:hypothetical protein